MTAKEHLNELLDTLPEDKLRQVLDFAQFLLLQREREEWQQFGRMQLARCYGENESDYSEADIKPSP